MVSRYQWLNLFVGSLLAFFIFSGVALAKSPEGISEVAFTKSEMKVGKKSIHVEVARSPMQHERGLMYREKLDKDTGMIFIFDDESTLNFWMKNTITDLSIAYIDKNLKIVDIQEMKSTKVGDKSDLPVYPSAKPAKYALEMEKGWFKKNKIKVGDTVTAPK